MAARAFFTASLQRVRDSPGRHFTRPVVILLSNGLRVLALKETLDRPIPEARGQGMPARPLRFRPQKAVALSRLRILAVLGVVLAMGAIAVLFWIR